MTRYHVSEDGLARPCGASAGACPLGVKDGAEAPHGDFASKDEAQAFAEEVNASLFGGSFASERVDRLEAHLDAQRFLVSEVSPDLISNAAEMESNVVELGQALDQARRVAAVKPDSMGLMASDYEAALKLEDEAYEAARSTGAANPGEAAASAVRKHFREQHPQLAPFDRERIVAYVHRGLNSSTPRPEARSVDSLAEASQADRDTHYWRSVASGDRNAPAHRMEVLKKVKELEAEAAAAEAKASSLRGRLGSLFSR